MVRGQTKYHRTYLRLHRTYEEYAAPIIKQALDEQINPALKLIDEENYDSIDFYLSYLPTLPIKNALEEIYPVIGANAAGFSYRSIEQSIEHKGLHVAIGMEVKGIIDDALGFFNAEWIRDMVDYFLLNAGEKIKGITDTTIKEVRRVIAEAQQLNKSRREQAKYITDALGSEEFNRKRALVIARTESTTAANKGIALGAESSDYYVNKQWLATLDKRTRRDHITANGQQVGFNQSFYVGGVPMAQPGDPTAPAAQCVNCRCVLLVVPVLDELGLPVLKPRVSRLERV